MNDTAYDRARDSQKLAARRLHKRLARPPQVRPNHILVLTSGSDAQRRGHAVEGRARTLLQACGLQILATNLCCRSGEIDLVAREAKTLVFIEVRHRSSPRFGGAAASVNRPKQARLIRAARYFLPALTRCCFAGRTPACRFDVIAQEGADMHWIRDAFSADLT